MMSIPRGAAVAWTLLLCYTTVALQAASTARRAKSELAGGQNCTNHLEVIDRCSSLATFSYTTNFNQYPVSAAELRLSCERIGEGLKCLKTHAKCLSSVARRSLNSYSGSRARHSRRLCANLADQKSVDFWRAGECIQSKNKREPLVANERALIQHIQLLAVSPNITWEGRIHQACCAASTYKLKALREIEPECVKYKQSTEEMLDSMLGDLLEAVCPEEKRLREICVRLPKLSVSKDWKAVSLTGAALDLIVALSDTPKN